MPSNPTKPAKPASKAGHNGTPLISDDKLRQLYAMMMKCRLLEERHRPLRKPGNFSGDDRAANRQEATEVGCALDLLPEDTIVSSRHDCIAGFIKGIPLGRLLGRAYGRPARRGEASSPSFDGSLPHIIPPVSTLGAHFSIGAGVALANKMNKNGHVVVVFSSKRDASPGLWRETLDFSGIHNLPAVFVVQSGQECIAPILQVEERDPGANAETHRVTTIAVDGNDVIAVYRVAHEAIAKARMEAGPTLIECRSHETQEDPIRFMENHLRHKGLWSDRFKMDLQREFTRELEAAVKAAAKAGKTVPGRKGRHQARA